VPWSKAGIAAAVLALLAAGLGLIVAVALAMTTRDMLLDGAHYEARVVKLAIRYRLYQESTARLREAALAPPPVLPARQDAGDFERWLGPIVLFDGTQFLRADAAAADDARGASLEQLLQAELRAHWQRAATQPATIDRLSFVTAGWDGKTVLLAELDMRRATQPRVAAAILDTEKLRQDVIAPILQRQRQPRIELIESGNVDRIWTEPLERPLSFWMLAPTDAFVADLNRTVRRQVAIQALITVLPLAAVLGVMWALARVARREMALSQLKSAFVADVSHELKTPLALIRMFGETLLGERVASPEKAREYYAIIARESTRLTNLIDNLLDFSRIDAGRRIYRSRPVDIAQIVRDTYEAYRHELDREHFEHRLRLAANLPPIEADPDAVAQALLNLMNNAVKYSDHDRFLSIEVDHETRRGRRGVLISVHDRGIGIRPEDRARLFEGFFRASDERVRQRRGAGLGLALVKHIVDAHGGSIDVESRLVKGSTFRIFLPAAGLAPAP
jgi:signal transduction histidine kinase